MTESEAKGFIQGKLDCMNKCGVFNKEDNISDNDCDNCEYCYSQGNFGNQKKAFQMVLQALEKQIPKKVELRHIRKFDGFDDGECPTCCNSVSRDCDGTDNFCPDCGQKLDWRGEE